MPTFLPISAGLNQALVSFHFICFLYFTSIQIKFNLCFNSDSWSREQYTGVFHIVCLRLFSQGVLYPPPFSLSVLCQLSSKTTSRHCSVFRSIGHAQNMCQVPLVALTSWILHFQFCRVANLVRKSIYFYLFRVGTLLTQGFTT